MIEENKKKNMRKKTTTTISTKIDKTLKKDLECFDWYTIKEMMLNKTLYKNINPLSSKTLRLNDSTEIVATISSKADHKLSLNRKGRIETIDLKKIDKYTENLLDALIELETLEI